MRKKQLLWLKITDYYQQKSLLLIVLIIGNTGFQQKKYSLNYKACLNFYLKKSMLLLYL